MKRQHFTEEIKKQREARDVKRIKHYRALQDKVLNLKNEKTYTADSFKLTTELLQLNPEFYTVWNYRRDIISNHFTKELNAEELIKLFDQELGFIMLRLKDFPKVYWIWGHRVWTLENHPKVNWEAELAIVSKLLTMDSRNC